MGYIKHNAIVVVGWQDDLDSAHVKAKEIFGGLVSDIVYSRVNSYKSFFVAPDGSKEGWADSNSGDDNRQMFLHEIKKLWVDAIDVGFGGDDDIVVFTRKGVF